MATDAALLEELLNEDEGSTLDFKRDQYPFAGADDVQKAEIIKDILAFANAWRRTDAYILIGVEEVRGGRSIVHGVTTHLPEHALQQLVNSKTNRPVEFSYSAFPTEGKQIGVLHIPIQPRPLFLTRDFGGLKKGVVYIRRGSSTGVADADEIAKMGEAAASQIPTLDVQFADIESSEPIGNTFTLACSVFRFPDRAQIPDAVGERYTVSTVNSAYYRQYARYLFIHRLVHPVQFVLHNTGSTLIRNARLRIRMNNAGGLRIMTESELPERPTYDYTTQIIRNNDAYILSKPKESVDIERYQEYYKVAIEFGDVQPKDNVLSDYIYVYAEWSTKMGISGMVFGDNLPDPVKISLEFNIVCTEHRKSVEDLMKEIKDDHTREHKRIDKLLEEHGYGS